MGNEQFDPMRVLDGLVLRMVKTQLSQLLVTKATVAFFVVSKLPNAFVRSRREIEP